MEVERLHFKWYALQDKAPYRDDMSGSDDEDNHDAYLERMKAEGKDRQSGDKDDDSDSSGKCWCAFEN